MQTDGKIWLVASLCAALAAVSGTPAFANRPATFAPQATNASPATTPDEPYPAILIIPTSKSGQTGESASLDQTVCKMGPPPTGSRLGGTRECHTQREWNDIRQEQWSQLSHFQLLSTQSNFMHDCCEMLPGKPPIGQ